MKQASPKSFFSPFISLLMGSAVEVILPLRSSPMQWLLNRVSLSRPSAFRSFHGSWCSSNLYRRASLAIRPSSLSSLFSTSFLPSGPGSSPFRIWMTAFSVLSKTASGTRKKLKLVGFWYWFLKFVKNSSRGVVRSSLRKLLLFFLSGGTTSMLPSCSFILEMTAVLFVLLSRTAITCSS